MLNLNPPPFLKPKGCGTHVPWPLAGSMAPDSGAWALALVHYVAFTAWVETGGFAEELGRGI